MSVAERHTGQTAMVRVSLALRTHGSQNTCPHASVCGRYMVSMQIPHSSRSAPAAAAEAGGAFSPFASRSPAESSVAPAG